MDEMHPNGVHKRVYEQIETPTISVAHGLTVCFKDNKGSQAMGDYFTKLGRPTYGIAKIKASGNCFIGDASKCFDGTIYKKENLRLAEL